MFTYSTFFFRVLVSPLSAVYKWQQGNVLIWPLLAAASLELHGTKPLLCLSHSYLITVSAPYLCIQHSVQAPDWFTGLNEWPDCWQKVELPAVSTSYLPICLFVLWLCCADAPRHTVKEEVLCKIQFCDKKKSSKPMRFRVFARGFAVPCICSWHEHNRCSPVSERVQITASRYHDSPHLCTFHEPPSVSLLTAECEEKTQGPPVNGRKGKWSEQCDLVTLLCLSGQQQFNYILFIFIHIYITVVIFPFYLQQYKEKKHFLWNLYVEWLHLSTVRLSSHSVFNDSCFRIRSHKTMFLFRTFGDT